MWAPWDKPDWDRPAADNRLEQSRTERTGVTDGLRLPAIPLICSEEKPETHRLRGCRADKQVGAADR